jgi:preprotein translocase subunit YajC
MHWLDLVGTAYAQAPAAAPKGPSTLEMLVMPIGFLAIMYLFVIRPQSKRQKEHSSLLSNLKAGDEIVTSGGIIGKVRSVAEAFVTIEISNNATVKVLKSAITSLAATKLAPTPAKEPAKT